MTVAEAIKHAAGADGTPSQAATRQEMSDAKLPLAYRDSACSKLLIGLNKCRQKEYYLPWKCQDERHGYEKCLYDDFLVRMHKQEQFKAEQQGKPLE